MSGCVRWLLGPEIHAKHPTPFGPIRPDRERERGIHRANAAWGFPDDEEGWIPGLEAIGPPAPHSQIGAQMAARWLAGRPDLDLAELEGRLLARQSVQAIATRFGVCRRAIRVFKACYFRIDGRSDFHLLLEAVPGFRDRHRAEEIASGYLRDDPSVQIRYFALTGGLHVLERVLEVLRDPDRQFDLSTRDGIRAAMSWLRVRYVLALHGIEPGDPVMLRKRSVFQRLERQLALRPARRSIWKPLRQTSISTPVNSQDIAWEKLLQDVLRAFPALSRGLDIFRTGSGGATKGQAAKKPTKAKASRGRVRSEAV